MFVLGLLLLKILGKYILLGFVSFVKAKKSGFSKLGLGRLFPAEPFLRFSKSNN